MKDSDPKTGDAKVLRLGTVPYLNVQPLLWALQDEARAPELHAVLRGRWPGGVEICSAVPSALAAQLAGGDFDAAIAPVYEAFRQPSFHIAEGVAIGCHGAVASVLVVHDKPFEELRTIAADPDSLTSNNLLRVLLARDGHPAQLVDAACKADGRLVIGDPAFAAAGEWPHHRDLGQWWFDVTGGMPFVFAAWLIPDTSCDVTLVGILQESKRVGMANLRRVANDCAAEFGKTPDAAHRYFRENLCYELGAEQREALKTFRQWATGDDGLSPLLYLRGVLPGAAGETRQIPKA